MEAVNRRAARDIAVFLAFAALTVAMTWPWAAHLRDAAADPGDPYLNSWILWWDFHQTFHDPLHLFDGNIFYPMKDTLAFSEHNYGIALPLFPLFALGLRPLTATSIATLLGFAFSGYGAFRLARTLTGSNPVAWIAGIAFAFTPYRFDQLSHVNYLFAGWIPLLFEALVLFVRERSKRRAAWLGAALFFNALTCIHWMLLTAVPLAVLAAILVTRARAWKDPALRRGILALAAAGIALLPFLLPYARAARRYGLTRTGEETRDLSARASDWITCTPRNKLWHDLGSPVDGEHILFPGLLMLALPLAALLLVEPGAAPHAAPEPARAAPRRTLAFLDAVSLAAAALAAWSSLRPLRIAVGEHELLRVSDPSRALAVLCVALLARVSLAWPRALPMRQPNLAASVRAWRRSDAIVTGLLLALLGVAGSFGMRFPFHRVLFETVPVFRSIRVPTRWAMVAHLGLALLAALGVARLGERLGPRGARVLTAVFALAFLFEMRAAPMDGWIFRGAADPDEVTRALARLPMKGGIVELPSGGLFNYAYVLRAADHRKPLVDAVSGFTTPAVTRLTDLAGQRPIPDALLDDIEGFPTSYVVFHEALVEAGDRPAWRTFLGRAVEVGRLRLVGRFDGARNALYAVTRTEPQAGAAPEPAAYGKEDPGLLGNVDEPSEGARVAGTLTVRGWARRPGEDLDVVVKIDGEARPPASSRRWPRPDVCGAFPRMAPCASAGFEATFPFRAGDAGPHEIVAVFRTKDGRARHYPPRRFEWRP